MSVGIVQSIRIQHGDRTIFGAESKFLGIPVAKIFGLFATAGCGTCTISGAYTASATVPGAALLAPSSLFFTSTTAGSIKFAFGRGPKAEGKTHNYPYFVTVTRRDRSVLAKEAFNLVVSRGGC